MTTSKDLAELNRQYRQNRGDIEGLHDLLETTNKDLREIKTKVDTLASEMDRRFVVHDKRFDAHDRRFDAHDRRFDALDSQLGEVLMILRATKD